MQIHNLIPRTKNKKSQQVGRGGKRGKTSGRGMKGQKARSGRKIRPEMRDIIKKLPKLRGRGKSALTSIQENAFVVNVGTLNEVFNAGDAISPATLSAKGLVKSFKSRDISVKILGNGELSKKLTFSGVAFSKEAKAKIEKAGGTIETANK